MIGNKIYFVNIENDKGSVSFGNNNSTKVLGKGAIKLGFKNYLDENFLLVDNMKHNLLSVSQMCDQGHELIFNSKGCQIRKQGSRKLVATTTRTPNNIYVCMRLSLRNATWEKKMKDALARKNGAYTF